MLDDFLVRALIAGFGIALAAAPLGCLMVWRRMAFFGDATAHAAILGVALALAFDVAILFGVLGTAVAMAMILGSMSERTNGSDTQLAVMSHSALALGLVAVSFLQEVRFDLDTYLFGDILAVDRADLLVVWIGAALVLALIAWRWNPLLTATLNPDLAIASGINARREQLFLTLSLSLVVAVAIKVIGALLIAALLIVPAAAARPLSRTPEGMLVVTTVIAAASVGGGLWASALFDTPSGPTIICVAALAFVITSTLRRLA
ncbi:metal ABC transporter permease [Nereida sp. MMG025]|uniref:metal ABC transporter permease n=1 Tax=Nereida sp. MMG025 TaxID=2909981 RepID=UPI001F013343|nr:metal ABC transporter permease [Nereida sp. MMG025]MCF6443733.1 metal ABC transporter permease [Nereida sp. MMG025]